MKKGASGEALGFVIAFLCTGLILGLLAVWVRGMWKKQAEFSTGAPGRWEAFTQPVLLELALRQTRAGLRRWCVFNQSRRRHYHAALYTSLAAGLFLIAASFFVYARTGAERYRLGGFVITGVLLVLHLPFCVNLWRIARQKEEMLTFCFCEHSLWVGKEQEERHEIRHENIAAVYETSHAFYVYEPRRPLCLVLDKDQLAGKEIVFLHRYFEQKMWGKYICFL